jgi:sugar phosphate isomerase/epimerase
MRIFSVSYTTEKQSLSTKWAVIIVRKMTQVPALTSRFANALDQAGDALSPSQMVDVLDRSGAGALGLDAGLEAARLDGLLRELASRRPDLPILSVEAPCPHTRASAAALAALDRDEAEAAAQAAEATVRLAGDVRARFVILRLGAVGPVARDWTSARERFLRGQLDAETATAMHEARDRAAGRSLDRARRAIDRLARAAEASGVTLLIANPRRYVELPSPRELDFLLADAAGAPLAPLCDVAAAHLVDAMGFQPLALTVAAFGRGPLAYLGDACGPIGALAPGRGLLDVPALARELGAAALAFSPWPGLSVDEVVEALPALAAVAAANCRTPGTINSADSKTGNR